jgi:hypothetical protein
MRSKALLVGHGRQVVIVPDTGSLRDDLAGHLASLAEYFNTTIGRSLLRTGVIGPNNWAPARVRSDLGQANVDAVCVIFERAQRRNEIPSRATPSAAAEASTSASELGTTWTLADVPRRPTFF